MQHNRIMLSRPADAEGAAPVAQCTHVQLTMGGMFGYPVHRVPAHMRACSTSSACLGYGLIKLGEWHNSLQLSE